MTIAEKYSNLKAKSIKDMVLEIVEEVAKKCQTNSLEIVCGWWETDDLPKAEKNSLTLWQANATITKSTEY